MFLDTAFLRNDEIRLLLEKTVDGDEKKELGSCLSFFYLHSQWS